MHSKWVFKHFYPGSNTRNIILALLWVGGLLIGVLLCALAPYNAKNILYGALHTRPTLLSLLLVCVLPLLLTATAVFTSLFPIAYALVLVSAIAHGFSGTAVYLAVGSAAWIVRPVLLFTASSTSVLMWWLVLQCKTRDRAYKSVCLALCLSCLIYIIDLFILSPFIGDLTKVL